MLKKQEIDQIAREAANTTLGQANVAAVSSEPTIDSEGRDALRITIIVPDEAAPNISGDAALDTLVNLHHRLQQAGEERLAIVEYTTPKELSAVDDAES